MLPIILQLDPVAARHHRAALTPQALADVLADALPQALAQFEAGIAQSVMVACGDMTALQAHQVLTLQIATWSASLTSRTPPTTDGLTRLK
ncbi:hypothetical protein [Xanthomonas euvesicatoria]|uniref:hypothetical protein n=1 Tax=Xanthomonas euvesicatoria TaxID=456327 RepID=UPI001C493E8B|nr:hypothetical protein [Xanthomonas euvesicatoria]MBV6807467.1 hypothetical protein [Xanthomonas campestris pv. convolvuli]